MQTATQTSDKTTLLTRVRFRFATAACATAVALLVMPAATSAGQIDPRTGQANLSARQAARLEKLHADTRASATRKALSAAAEPLYHRVIPVRPTWLAPKGQP